MKKVICFAILSIALTNCQKKNKLTAEPSTTVEQTNTTTEVKHSNARGIPTKYRKIKRTLGDYNCYDRDGNCLDDVIVKPSSADFVLLTNLITTVKGGNQQAIKQFFEVNQKALNVYIPLEEIQAVLAGQDIPTLYVNKDGYSNYLLFSNKDTLMLALPLIL